MKSRIIILLMMLAVGTQLYAAEPIELSIQVAAAPLQAWRALAVDWQLIQWSSAETAYLEVREAGIWRINYGDQRVEEGFYEIVDRGAVLGFTYLMDDQTTHVTVRTNPSPGGCEIFVTHAGFSDNRKGEELRSKVLELWETKLPKLSAYLDRVPGSYLARPNAEGQYPAVLLLHDRFGLNRTIRDFADSLANNGYVCLVVDMFKGDVTADLTQATRFLDLVNDEESIATAREGVKYLKGDSGVNSRRIAVWGIGYGGSMAVHLATQVPDFRLCANWYGDELPGPDQLPRIAAPVFSVFAGATPTSGTPYASRVNQEFINAGLNAETVVVFGTDGFADPGYGTTFSPMAVTDAWRRTISHLDQQMKL